LLREEDLQASAEETEPSLTNFQISNRFKGIMRLEKLGKDLIIVENVWKHLLKKMVMPLEVKKY
jgi:hypothetical protein